MDETFECQNCGKVTEVGKGYPPGKFECCCSGECFTELCEYGERE